MDVAMAMKEEPVWPSTSHENLESVSELVSVKEEAKSEVTLAQQTQEDSFESEMDLEVQIKAEPVWLEDEANTSHENVVFVSEMKPLKQESKSELTEPGLTQENAFEPSAYIKEEISIEQHIVDELVPHIKEENNGSHFAVLTAPAGQEANAGTMQSKTFLHKLNVRKRISAPSAGRPYQCKVCNISFTLKSNLRIHTVIHTGRKPYYCMECDSSFTQRSNLRKHMVLHSGDKSYYCNECNSSFTQKSILLAHMIVHSREKQFCCKECNSSFTQKSNLRTHMVVHTRQKPYFCKECNSSFTQKSNLRTHMVLYSGKKPYFCNECNSSFAQKGTLRTHMSVHSKRKPSSGDK